MDDGCKLISEKQCSKFGVPCSGWKEEKEKCPLWGEVLAAEKYYAEKSRYEKGVQEEEDEAKAEEWKEVYNKHKGTLAYQVNNGSIVWKQIKGVFDMKSERIAKNYVTSHLKSEGLICCVNCAKWTREEICKESKQSTDASFTCRNFSKR
ncbi:hypothetical protein MSSAC_1009 [Methanosarcina siciliae C2J]|uniref:Uncharacterized protein n=1 Tax=Methanosarcina siciliae C2J TaxID=1434118 RepID=A0A0E3PKL6_9EURY|nr:hypothetical protein [Methanosarcina siciliae]AKB35599.1 hypothetical protein MSSAC_1009 [Methanosarcina siciliae C2J]